MPSKPPVRTKVTRSRASSPTTPATPWVDRQRPDLDKASRDGLAKHAHAAAEDARRRIPDDFLFSGGETSHRADLLISRLLIARGRLSDPTKRADAGDLVDRLYRALIDARPEPLALVETLVYFAEADPLVYDGRKLRPDQDARLALAMAEISTFASHLHVPEELVRDAMWPARGAAKRARGALARALGWKGKDNSVHVRLAQRKR